MLQVKQLLLLLRRMSQVYTQEEGGRWSQALGTWSSATSIDNKVCSAFVAHGSFFPLFPATVTISRQVIKAVYCDTPLISPGADHSIFNSDGYTPPTVEEASLLDQYYQSSYKSLHVHHKI